MGCTEADSDLVVGAHAHAERADAVTPRDFAQQREMQRWLLVHWRNAHQAGDGEAKPSAAIGDEGIGLGRWHASLLRLLAGIDLDEERRPARRALELARQRFRQAGPVERLDDIEEADCLLDL